MDYRKIPKILSPGAYISQRPFLRGLLLERFILGGAYAEGNLFAKSAGLMPERKFASQDRLRQESSVS